MLTQFCAGLSFVSKSNSYLLIFIYSFTEIYDINFQTANLKTFTAKAFIIYSEFSQLSALIRNSLL